MNAGVIVLLGVAVIILVAASVSDKVDGRFNDRCTAAGGVPYRANLCLDPAVIIRVKP